MRITDSLNSIPEVYGMHCNSGLFYDLASTILGSKLGEGAHRVVFNYNLDSKYVIKAEVDDNVCNTAEWLMWNEISGLTGNLAWVKDWFAPVGWISPNGKLLTMRKTKPHVSGKERPKRIPSFLWDVKEDNFGWLGNKYVCHDYGQFYNFIAYPTRMVKAPWVKK